VGEADGRVEIVSIRFRTMNILSPDALQETLSIFAEGADTVCPYLVFAARSPASRYSDSEFLIGNASPTRRSP
jgi:hypothetical protein